ncbi:MAG: antirestriction protein ArdA [Faecousia sp.]
MMFSVVIRNKDHPEYGEATIPFPVKTENYDEIMGMMEQLEIGNAVASDCYIESIDSWYTSLKCLEGKTVNFDELDYLAKRIESYNEYEAAQFQSVVALRKAENLPELINLTFSSQQATVITNFSNLKEVGQDHIMTRNGGMMSREEAESTDFERVARELIGSGKGVVTPYGVVYDNDMKMDRLYTKGSPFPSYYYEPSTLVVEMTSARKPYRPDNESDKTWLFLPMSTKQLEHAMMRAGLVSFDDMRLRFVESNMPESVDTVINFEHEGILELNEMSKVIKALPDADRAKLDAVALFVQPQYAFQIKLLAENLDQFEFIPGVKNAEEYGRYMIQESGHFEYDPNLENFYDYARYAEQRMREQSGEFTLNGYVSYHGTMSIDELIMEDPASQSMKMGGMSM